VGRRASYFSSVLIRAYVYWCGHSKPLFFIFLLVCDLRLALVLYMVVVALFIKRGEAKRSEEKPISGFNLNRVFAENYSMVIHEVKSKVASSRM
jgi:hypothetical protein